MALTVRLSGRKLLLCMGITAALVAGTTACTGTSSASDTSGSSDASDTGKVVSITDGDTLVASVNGQEKTIRLLNIDTPETKDPHKPAECLGQEASDFLRKLLPAGTTITLKYDVERLDKYDRTLAAVYTPSNDFVSAEIARAGLGTAVSFGKNTKFLPPVEEAELEAKSGTQGIHDPGAECTLPAQVKAVSAALGDAHPSTAPATAAGPGTAIAASAAAIARAKSLLALLKAGKTGTDTVKWAAYTGVELAQQIESLSSGVHKAEESAAGLEAQRNALDAAEAEAAAAAAAAAQAEAAAAAAAAAQAAAEQAQAEANAWAQSQAEAEAERIRNLPPVYVPPAPEPYVPPAPPAYEPPAGNSGGGHDGYTGPRCYLPGGKSYRPC